MVVQAYCTRPELRITAVPTQSATAASNWLAIPNIGQICEIEPVRMKYDQAKTTAKVEISVPGSQLVFSNGFQARPRNSWTMKRATRVPVSIVVRMKSASNMMAKWYQYDISPPRNGMPEKIWANPTASETAPPVRPTSVSPTIVEKCWRLTVDNPSLAKSAGGTL